MASASPRPAFVPVEPRAGPHPARTTLDPLHGDRIDFDAWLLPPERIGAAERVIRAVSWAAGPVAAVVLGIGLVVAIL